MRTFKTQICIRRIHCVSNFAQRQEFTWSTLVGGGGEQEQAEPDSEAKSDNDEMPRSLISSPFDDIIGIVLTRPGHMVHSIV